MNASKHKLWELFDEHGGVFELRGIKNGLPTKTKVISWQQFPEDVSLEPMRVDFEQTAMAWDTAGYNVYAVLNSIDEDFSSSSVKDSDIEARSYMLIDIDRTETADCPASDEEVQHAIGLSDVIRRFMSKHGWLEPLVVMSGNGIHLYYYLNYLPNTPELTDKIRELLQLLGDEFDNAHVKVDRSVYNASRITKVIGTTAKKGIESPGRPYRKVEILRLPGRNGLRVPNFDTLLDNTLNELRDGRPSKPRPLTKTAANFKSVELDDTPNNLAKVARLLYKISPDRDRHTWFPIVWSVLSTGITGTEELARDWSIQSDRYTETDFDNLIRDYDPDVVNRGGQISIGTLYYYADKAEAAAQGGDDERE
jgi:hypothetical protein